MGVRLTSWVRLSLLLATAMLTMTSSTELQVTSGLLLALKTYFKADCVSLVSSTLHSHDVARNLSKKMSLDHVATSLLDSKILLGASQNATHCLRPLNLLLFDWFKVALYWSQFSPKLRVSQHVWLLFLEEGQSLEDVFHGVYIPFDCEFLVARSSGGDVILHEVYRVAKTWPLRSERFASWRAGQGLTAPQGGLYTRRHSLHGLTLRATNLHSPPLSIISVVKGLVLLTGFYGDIWNILEESANFTTIHIVPDVGETNQYDEMFRQVVTGEADATSTCILHSAARNFVADFTMPEKIIPFRIFIAEPTVREVKWDDFLSPFSRSLWFSLMGSTLVAASLLSLLNHLMERVANKSQDSYPLQDAVFLVFGSVFCQQGHAQNPSAIPCRIVHIVTLLLGTIVFNSYSSNLIALLTVFAPSMPFETMEELYEKNDFSFAVVKNSMSHISLKKAESGILKLLYERDVMGQPRNSPETYLEGFQHACDSRYAFVALSEFLTVERDNISCSLVYLPQRFTTSSASIAMTKGSPYRGLFNHILLRLYEGGFMTKLYKMALDERISDPPEDLASINMGHITPILSIFVSGVFAALLVLVLERSLEFLKLWDISHLSAPPVMNSQPSCLDEGKEMGPFNVEWID